jgi:hypothetical protein
MRKNIYVVSCLTLFAYVIVYYQNCKLGHYYYIALLNVCAFYVWFEKVSCHSNIVKSFNISTTIM